MSKFRHPFEKQLGHFTIHVSPACYVRLFLVGLTTFGVAGTMWSATSTCKTRLFWAKYDPLHQPNQCSALLENWHTGSRTVSGAAHQASWPGATPFEDYIRPREATQHYCSSTCFQATPSNRPGVVRMRHKLANTQTRRSSICPENFGPCLCFVWPPQPCKVTPCHMFQTPNGP